METRDVIEKEFIKSISDLDVDIDMYPLLRLIFIRGFLTVLKYRK